MTLKEQIALLQGIEAGRKLQRRTKSGLSRNPYPWEEAFDRPYDPTRLSSIDLKPAEFEYRLAPEPRKCLMIWEGQKPVGVTDNYYDAKDVVQMVEVMP